jgi:hypothetical protein
MTFEQAVSFALDVAQRRQRPAYVVELAAGWAIITYKPRHGRAVAVEPPAPDPHDDEDDPE